MPERILFKEQQKFKQWWLLLILFGTNGLFLFGVVKQVMNGQNFGNNPMSDAGLLLASGFTLLITAFILNIRLETIIRPDGIHMRFFPLHLKFKHFRWDEIEQYSIRKYAALSEYGGWGLRTSFSKHGTAYTVSGDAGLQLELKSGKKLLIGTKKPVELREALSKR